MLLKYKVEMGKKVLFINNSDLADSDSNGRTLRDVFSFVKDEDILSFCITRKNPSLKRESVFFANESLLFHPLKMKKGALSTPIPAINAKTEKNIGINRPKKNPLTCILRNAAWRITFLFLKGEYKKWLFKNNPDYIVFDPADFLFMHHVASYTSKILKKSLILYNTEDYYFKEWNYLHKENGFGFLYPLFRKKLIRCYKKTFSLTKICFHNVTGLRDKYKEEFPEVKHLLAFHPSKIRALEKPFVSTSYRDFYYCGSLDKGRDETMLLLAQTLKDHYPKAKIYFNGRSMRQFDDKAIERLGNVVNLGFCPYDEIKKKLNDSLILVSIGSFDAYNAKDKYHGFSTKLSDYISSLNPIIHIGPEGEELHILKDNNLAYICKNKGKILDTLKDLFSSLQSQKTDKYMSQREFYIKYLNPETVSAEVQKAILNEHFIEN